MTLKIFFTLATTFIISAQGAEAIEEEKNVAIDVDPKLVKYIDKSYMDLSNKGFGSIDKIVKSSVNSCVLLENKILYCEYGENKEIKLQLQTRTENEIKQISLLLLEQDILQISTIKKPTIGDKNKSLTMENRELRAKLENMYTLVSEQKEQIKRALKYKKKVSELKTEIEGYDEIIKKNIQLCEIEKTEILSLTKNKNYKSLKEYTNSTKQLIKIKEQRESIRELLAIIDKYKNAKQLKENKQLKKEEKSTGISKYLPF